MRPWGLRDQLGRSDPSGRLFRSSLRNSRSYSGSIRRCFDSSLVWNNPDHSRIRADIRRRARLQIRSPCVCPYPGRGSPSEFFACMNDTSIGYPPNLFLPLYIRRREKRRSAWRRPFHVMRVVLIWFRHFASRFSYASVTTWFFFPTEHRGTGNPSPMALMRFFI